MITKARLVTIAAILTVAAAANLFAARIVERIIARINNEIVTQRQFERERERLREQLAQQYSGPELEVQFRTQSKDLLRDLIDQDLMVQKAKDDDINVDTDVVKKLDQIRQQYHMNTIDDLQKAVEKQGIIWEDFTDQIKRQLLMRGVIEREVGSRINVSREDARKYFNEHKQQFASPEGVRLAEILISPDKHTPAEVEQRAKDAAAELKAGQRFADVAKKYSDASDAAEGGDIGFFKSGTMVPEIEAAVKKLDINDTSDPIQTKRGTIIVKLLDRRQAGIPKFEDVEQQVMNMLYDQKMQPALRKYLTELRKESYVFIAPGFQDTGAERPSEAVAAANTLP
ncbi:MAG TPA: peptidylprolyl isomerase [Terriglobia bacterium]|nr:peptidylprolyl isomerase [Terriglobia bacterium]